MIVLMLIFDTYHKRVTGKGKSIYAIMALTFSLDFKPNIFSKSIQKYVKLTIISISHKLNLCLDKLVLE